MYKIYCDNYIIHDSENLEEMRVVNPRLSEELNKTSILTFEIYPDHIHYDKLSRLKSIISIYKDNEIIFKGRFIDDVQGFYNERQVACEGSLSFFGVPSMVHS